MRNCQETSRKIKICSEDELLYYMLVYYQDSYIGDL